MRLIPLLDAKKLADRNNAERKKLVNRQTKATKRAERAETRLNAAYTDAFDTFLAPFAKEFARIKNVELGELQDVGVVPEMQRIDVTVRAVAVDAVRGLAVVAGSAATGAAVGGLTFATVGALATASTGAAISGLSGAAATSATLAWLGGGSLAAGGGGVAAGTAVLASVVAAPVLLAVGGFLWWQGEKAYQEQCKVEQKLKQAEAKLMPQVTKADLASDRALDNAYVVNTLTSVGRQRLPALRQAIQRSDDYHDFTQTERETLAELAGIATTIAAVITCPMLDKAGNVTSLSTDTLDTARSLGLRLAA